MTRNHPPPTPKLQPMRPAEFALIARLAKSNAGLVFPESKVSLVSSRLTKRLRELRFNNFTEYCDLLTSNDVASEVTHMISALTTNISSFFRENHHFKFLEANILPELIRRAQMGEKIRIWSAGCSVGMEAYSIAMTILEVCEEADELDIRILATDINPTVINLGRSGFYDKTTLISVPNGLREKYFVTGGATESLNLQVTPQLQRMVTFKELNLIKNWPTKGPFDIIFCRNTVIYFDDATQRALWPRFQSMLPLGGWLFLGHSERIQYGCAPKLKSCGMTIYQRVDD